MEDLPSSLNIRFDVHITQYSPAETYLLDQVTSLARTLTTESTTSSARSESRSSIDLTDKDRLLDDDCKADLEFDGLINWHQGRADLEAVIEGGVKRATGPVSVNGESRRHVKTFCHFDHGVLTGRSTGQSLRPTGPTNLCSRGDSVCIPAVERAPGQPAAHPLSLGELWVVKTEKQFDPSVIGLDRVSGRVSHPKSPFFL
jgi:hypothetical protein